MGTDGSGVFAGGYGSAMTLTPPAIGTPAPVRVKSYTTEAAARWDDFVARQPAATFFHRAGWREVLERAFGHDTYYLYVESDGRIEGILPLGHIRSRLFGNALVSTPFCVYGGIVASTPAAHRALDQAACELAQRLGVDHLELRNLVASQGGRPTKDLYVTFRKTIDPDPEKNLLAIPRKQRAMVRKGINAGLASEMDDNLDRFYDTYAASVHRLGTPVFARKYFETLRTVFGRDCEVLTVVHNGNAVASVMSFYFRDEVLPYYGGGTVAAREVAANDFMYWEVMRRAAERGVRVFDYGRSKQGTGSYNFKKNWGFEPQPLPYEYVLVKSDRVPDVNPLNPKYRLLIEAWKRMPFALSKLIGPWLARSLG
jgi:FemAB-related protein (PEP-CTERM system-associated)